MTVYPLRLECIADDLYQELRGFPDRQKLAPQPWVARIIGVSYQRMGREFLRGLKDYTYANSVGSRGVYLTFWLQEDDLYEVFRRESWSRHRRYFVVPDKSGIVEIGDKEDALTWLKDHSVLLY